MTKDFYSFTIIVLSVFVNQLLAQSTAISVGKCNYTETTISNVINGIIEQSKNQPNQTSRNDFLFNNIEKFQTDLTNCTSIEKYIETFGTSQSFLHRATDIFLWLWGLPLKIITNILDSILNAILGVVGRLLNNISSWIFSGISYMANGFMDFKLTWLIKFYDAFYPRIYDLVITIGPGILGGFLFLLVPNYTEFMGQITGEILKLVINVSGSLNTILNPLSLIPGGSWLSNWFGSGSSGSTGSSSSGSTGSGSVPQKDNSTSSGWISWLG